MQINAYLMFKGQCDAALKFYEKVLGAKTVMKLTYGNRRWEKTCRRTSKTRSCTHAWISAGRP